ncbi:unnamed protein product, partial [marine sediment metagenome]
RYFPHQNFNKLIKTWKKKLIPGGIIKIQINLKNNERRFEILRKALKKNLFFIKTVDKSDLKINGSINIVAIKQKIIKTTSVPISLKKFNDLSIILKQNKDIISDKNNLCILGAQSNKIKVFLKNINLNVNQIHTFEKINS